MTQFPPAKPLPVTIQSELYRDMLPSQLHTHKAMSRYNLVYCDIITQSFKPPQLRYKVCIMTQLPPAKLHSQNGYVTIQFSLYRDTVWVVAQPILLHLCFFFFFFRFSHTLLLLLLFHFCYWKNTQKNMYIYFFFLICQNTQINLLKVISLIFFRFHTL